MDYNFHPFLFLSFSPSEGGYDVYMVDENSWYESERFYENMQ